MITTPFISIQVDDEVVQNIILEQLKDNLAEINNEKVFYTMDDLQEITGFSKGHMMNTFFHDKRFAKIRRKVGRKWLFPVQDTRLFLLDWIKEQPHD